MAESKLYLTPTDYVPAVLWLLPSEKDSSGLANEFFRVGKMCNLSICTISKVHKEDDILGYIPDPYKPIRPAFGVGKCGEHPIAIKVATDGTIQLWSMPAQQTARVYAVVTWMMA